MLPLPVSVRVFLYTEPADMRRGFDGLGATVEQTMKRDPFTGHLYVFLNRCRDCTKILLWDRDGTRSFTNAWSVAASRCFVSFVHPTCGGTFRQTNWWHGSQATYQVFDPEERYFWGESTVT